MAELHEYAFDVKMNVVMRVEAESEEDVLEMVRGINCEDLDVHVGNGDVHITEASVVDRENPPFESGEPHLFEVDGEEV